jgi:hypothetical protein
MLRPIRVVVEGRKLHVSSPYHPDFPRLAHNVAGRWDGAQWAFDPRHEARVRNICREIYGTDGDDGVALVTVRAKKAALVGGSAREKSWFLAGCLVARTYSKDQAPTIGDGVAVVQGEVTSTGSHKNPGLAASDDLVIEILDVPAPAAEKALRSLPEGSIEIAAQTPDEVRARAMVCGKERHDLIRNDAHLFMILTSGPTRVTKDTDGTPLLEGRQCNACGSQVNRTMSEEAARRLEDIPPGSEPAEPAEPDTT